MAMERQHVYQFGSFQLDPAQKILLHAGQRVPLNPKTFLILLALVEAEGRVVSKDNLVAKVWPNVIVEESNLTKNISLLRKLLGNGDESAEFIETIPKIGYRFIPSFKPVEDTQGDGPVQAGFVTAEERNGVGDEVVSLLNSDDPSRSKLPRQLKWKLLLSATLLLIIVAAGGWLWQRREQSVAALAKGTGNSESHQAYLKGLMLCQKRTTDGFQGGIEYLDQAVEKDPRNARAWTAKSKCYQLMSEGAGYSMAEMHQQATVMALKAIEIDDTLAEAHAQLGFLEFVQWYVASAERRLKRAIELNPNLVEAHARFGIVLLAQGRFDEALSEVRRCQELDPLAMDTRIHVTRSLYMARRYDEAIAQCRDYARLDPNFATAHLYMGLSYYHQGKFAEALLPLQQAVKTSDGRGETKAALAQTQAKLGHTAEAQVILNELKEQARRNMQESYYVASIYAAMDEKEQAFAWLEKAWQQRHPAFATRFKIDPNLDPLRPDPRYVDLLRRTGLAP